MTKILILACGGTIAGLSPKKGATEYKAGVLSAKKLLSALPQVKGAHIECEELFNIDSKDMDFDKLILLFKACQKALQAYDGVVVTHGTDSLEESAYFLSLLLSPKKALVFTAAMRPFNALSSDGLKNLYNALILAKSPKARGKGVLITLNDEIYSPKGLYKAKSTALNAFDAPFKLGFIDESVHFYEDFSAPQAFFQKEGKRLKKLERVGLLTSCVGDENINLARFLHESGVKALVVAGFGAGSLNEKFKKVLKELEKKGMLIILSSRVSEPNITSKDFTSFKSLNAFKSRLFISLALSLARDKKELQGFLKAYKLIND